MYYGARWYDPALGRFVSPDSIVPNPGDPQSLNRYAYVNNNPLRYTDPTGHVFECGVYGGTSCGDVGPKVPVEIVQAPPDVMENIGTVLKVVSAIYAVAFAGPTIAATLPTVSTTSVGTTATTAATAACADGDCTDEAQAIRRVFWSGGKVAQRAAEAWAKANNAETLEMTEVGQHLEKTTERLTWAEVQSQWIAASREFAAEATGAVHVFHSSTGVRLRSIWATVEYLELRLNQNVTQIIYHIVMPDGSDVIVP